MRQQDFRSLMGSNPDEARRALESLLDGHASGVRVSWEGGEPVDTGFPKLMHHAFGFTFSQRMEQLIDEEIQKLVDEKKARAAEGSPG
ncbi:hypothetical protein [Sorangium sp. So ce204]|uniref:hypothetical protein n=1 Tax=Sorangium sp. So ce204 TaxID=3133288 RepID=UPI003F6151F6